MADGESVAIQRNWSGGVIPERWKQVEAVFERALETPAGERSAFLKRTCGSDEELRREVESLLDSHRRAANCFDSADLFLSSNSFEESLSSLAPDQMVGYYRIVREV